MQLGPRKDVDILILGAGWTVDFLLAYLDAHQITWAATRRSLEPNPKYEHQTIPGCIKFDLDTATESEIGGLPSAKTILITFPLEHMQPIDLVAAYKRTHTLAPHWILLGSTGIWEAETYTDINSPYTHNLRAESEDKLLMFADGDAAVLCLAGLWGNKRQPKNWVGMVAGTREKLLKKKSLHLVNGDDVARAIIGCMLKWSNTADKRWIVTDGMVYDWWKLAKLWTASDSEQSQWVDEGMKQDGIKTLPRSNQVLGRALTSKQFWTAVDMAPAITVGGYDRADSSSTI